MMSGKAITAMVGAEFPRIDKLPQKQQMKFIAMLARKIKIKKSLSGRRKKTAHKIGKQQMSQLASIFAKIKISKFSQESEICSIVPSSKSFFKNSAEEKIRQESSENQMMIEVSNA